MILCPPYGFAYIEERLCRASVPIIPSMYGMLDSANIGTIVNVSGEPLDGQTISFMAESNIRLYNLYDNRVAIGDPFDQAVSEASMWLASAIEIICSLSFASCVLLLGSESCLDCMIVAGLRRIQRFDLTSILAEFRLFCGLEKLFDKEQFIESFDINLVRLPAVLPEFLQIHFDLMREESNIIDRVRCYQNASNSVQSSLSEVEDEEVHGLMDNLVYKLCLVDLPYLLSPGLAFEASTSLVQDKEDDD